MASFSSLRDSYSSSPAQQQQPLLGLTHFDFFQGVPCIHCIAHQALPMNTTAAPSQSPDWTIWHTKTSSILQSMGPNVATPELFAEALFTDTSSWTVIDRGPMEALLPITSVLENMVDTFDPASPGKTKLEVSP